MFLNIHNCASKVAFLKCSHIFTFYGTHQLQLKRDTRGLTTNCTRGKIHALSVDVCIHVSLYMRTRVLALHAHNIITCAQNYIIA